MSAITATLPRRVLEPEPHLRPLACGIYFRPFEQDFVRFPAAVLNGHIRTESGLRDRCDHATDAHLRVFFRPCEVQLFSNYHFHRVSLSWLPFPGFAFF